MFEKQALRLRDEAASEVLLRIRRIQEAAPELLHSLFSYLSNNLFDSALSVRTLWRVSGIRSRAQQELVRDLVGADLRTFVRNTRHEVASRLLVDTNMPVLQIGGLVGFSSIGSFSRSFARAQGIRPGRFRQAMASKSAADCPCDDIQPPEATLPLRRALQRRLQPADALALVRRLGVAGQPCVSFSSSGNNDLAPPLDPEHLEHRKAEALWSSIAHRTAEEQQAALQQVRFSTPAFFQLLCKKSREIGRNDRKLGVRIAELALASLRILDPEPLTPLERQQLDSLAWARLGNAYCLAFDLQAADRALGLANRGVRNIEDSTLRGEILYLTSVLRWFQRRIETALALLDEALAILRHSPDSRVTVEALILRAAIDYGIGEPEQGLKVISEALALIGSDPDPYLELAALQNRALCLVALKMFEEAEELLPSISALCAQIGTREGEFQVLWLEGLAFQGQGRLAEAAAILRKVLDGFILLDSLGHAAVVGLDLAIIRAQQGRALAVLEMAAEVIPMLEGLQYRREVLAALSLLQPALESGKLPESLLHKARELIQNVSRTP